MPIKREGIIFTVVWLTCLTVPAAAKAGLPAGRQLQDPSWAAALAQDQKHLQTEAVRRINANYREFNAACRAGRVVYARNILLELRLQLSDPALTDRYRRVVIQKIDKAEQRMFDVIRASAPVETGTMTYAGRPPVSGR